eukprot:scaffold47547_cov34-Tisochrysis_lutea.AAC.5
MERASASAPLLPSSPSVGPPAEGAPPMPMEQSVAKRPRPLEEAEQVSAIPVAPHGLWPRPHHPHQPCWSPSWGTAGCWLLAVSPTRPTTSDEPHRLSNGHALWQRLHSPWRRPRHLGGATRDRVAPMGTWAKTLHLNRQVTSIVHRH